MNYQPQPWPQPWSPPCYNELAELYRCLEEIETMKGIVAKIIADLLWNNKSSVQMIIQAFDKWGMEFPPLPGMGEPPVELASEAWVQDTIRGILAGPPAYATEPWVIANAVASFNTRTGQVVLLASDVSGVGGLINPSPDLQGAPTSTTPPLGDNSQRIVTTNWFWQSFVSGNITVSPPVLGQTNLQSVLESLASYVTGSSYEFSQDAMGYVAPSALADATVVMQGDMSGTATDTTGNATSISLSGDAST